jgi:uncharacterized membrane protein YjjP (DUF1212 family)
MIKDGKYKRWLWLLKALLLATMIYGWVWGDWDFHSFIDIAVTVIGVIALLLVW